MPKPKSKCDEGGEGGSSYDITSLPLCKRCNKPNPHKGDFCSIRCYDFWNLKNVPEVKAKFQAHQKVLEEDYMEKSLWDKEPTESDLDADIKAIREGRFDDTKLMMAVIKKHRPVELRKALAYNYHKEYKREREKIPEVREQSRERQRRYRNKIEVKEKLRKRSREYYSKNKERILANRRKWDDEHRVEIRAKYREYYAKNREKIRAKVKERYQKNPEYHEERIAKMRQWRDKNVEKSRSSSLKYYIKNREEILEKNKEKRKEKNEN